MELLRNCAAAGADARYREVERTPRYSGVSVSRGCSGAEGGSRLLSGSDFVDVDLAVFWEARASGLVKARGGRRGALHYPTLGDSLSSGHYFYSQPSLGKLRTVEGSS